MTSKQSLEDEIKSVNADMAVVRQMLRTPRAAGPLAVGLPGLTPAAGGACRQRPQTMACQSFGGAATSAANAPTSYKDFQDRWLGSADPGFDPLKLP